MPGPGSQLVEVSARALSQLGPWLKPRSQATAWARLGEGSIQCAIYHTEPSDSQQCVFDAGRAAQQAGWAMGHYQLWNNARAYPARDGQANLLPENPNNAANLQRKIKLRGFCFLSSSPLLSRGEDLGFLRNPGYSFHAGAEP